MQLSYSYLRRISLLVLLMVGAGSLIIASGIALARDFADQEQATSLPGPKKIVILDPQVRQRYVPPPAAYYESLTAPNVADSANIIINFIGSNWTTEAQDAFTFAADIWETLITSPVTIVIEADFSPLPPLVLGAAGPTTILRDFPDATQSNTWYPIGIANKLAGFDLDPSKTDIQANFKSNFSDWHFDTGVPTPNDKVSFASVVLHEIGHGLGFGGSMRMDDGTGPDECTGVAGRGCFGFGPDEYPMIFDRFIENGAGTGLLTFLNNSTNLATQLTSENVYFKSSGANYANGDERVPLYAPSTWNPGSSIAHLAETYNSTSHALMTYSLANGETVHSPGAITLCMFDDMGWSVSEDCPVDGLLAVNSSPTNLGITTYLSATITAGNNVTYTWSFGDGEFGSGQYANHLYDAIRQYTAVVTATNSINMITTTTVIDIRSVVYLPLILK